MPVILEQMTKIGPEDSQDLIKIYQNHPHLPSDNNIHWINNRLASGQHLYVGRFNSRLVGCLWVIVSEYHWQLEYLCVRDITRRRGVARQLLTLLTHEANANQANLIIHDNPDVQVIHPLLLELNFNLLTDNPQGNIWRKDPQS